MDTINLAIAGATGWTGRAIAAGALAAPDVTLKSGIARSSAGQDLGIALGSDPVGVPVYASVGEALDGVDVLVEFTSHSHAKAIVLAAIERGVAVVIGSSGLTADDYMEVDEAARAAGVGAIAAGNFSLTAAMMLAGAELAARHLPRWEIIDYAKSTKPDAPSGTARELAERLAEVRDPQVGFPPTRLLAAPTREARRSPAPRSTRCASRASSSPPRLSSAPPRNASASATTPAAAPHRTSRAYWWQCAGHGDTSALYEASIDCSFGRHRLQPADGVTDRTIGR